MYVTPCTQLTSRVCHTVHSANITCMSHRALSWHHVYVTPCTQLTSRVRHTMPSADSMPASRRPRHAVSWHHMYVTPYTHTSKRVPTMRHTVHHTMRYMVHIWCHIVHIRCHMVPHSARHNVHHTSNSKLNMTDTGLQRYPHSDSPWHWMTALPSQWLTLTGAVLLIACFFR